MRPGDIVYDQSGQVASTTAITSDAAIESRGFEAELTAYPSDSLDLIASISVVDAEYARVFASNVTDEYVSL